MSKILSKQQHHITKIFKSQGPLLQHRNLQVGLYAGVQNDSDRNKAAITTTGQNRQSQINKVQSDSSYLIKTNYDSQLANLTAASFDTLMPGQFLTRNLEPSSEETDEQSCLDSSSFNFDFQLTNDWKPKTRSQSTTSIQCDTFQTGEVTGESEDEVSAYCRSSISCEVLPITKQKIYEPVYLDLTDNKHSFSCSSFKTIKLPEEERSLRKELKSKLYDFGLKRENDDAIYSDPETNLLQIRKRNQQTQPKSHQIHLKTLNTESSPIKLNNTKNIKSFSNAEQVRCYSKGTSSGIKGFVQDNKTDNKSSKWVSWSKPHNNYSKEHVQDRLRGINIKNEKNINHKSTSSNLISSGRELFGPLVKTISYGKQMMYEIKRLTKSLNVEDYLPKKKNYEREKAYYSENQKNVTVSQDELKSTNKHVNSDVLREHYSRKLQNDRSKLPIRYPGESHQIMKYNNVSLKQNKTEKHTTKKSSGSELQHITGSTNLKKNTESKTKLNNFKEDITARVKQTTGVQKSSANRGISNVPGNNITDYSKTEQPTMMGDNYKNISEDVSKSTSVRNKLSNHSLPPIISPKNKNEQLSAKSDDDQLNTITNNEIRDALESKISEENPLVKSKPQSILDKQEVKKSVIEERYCPWKNKDIYINSIEKTTDTPPEKKLQTLTSLDMFTKPRLTNSFNTPSYLGRRALDSEHKIKNRISDGSFDPSQNRKTQSTNTVRLFENKKSGGISQYRTPTKKSSSYNIGMDLTHHSHKKKNEPFVGYFKEKIGEINPNEEDIYFELVQKKPVTEVLKTETQESNTEKSDDLLNRRVFKLIKPPEKFSRLNNSAQQKTEGNALNNANSIRDSELKYERNILKNKKKHTLWPVPKTGILDDSKTDIVKFKKSTGYKINTGLTNEWNINKDKKVDDSQRINFNNKINTFDKTLREVLTTTISNSKHKLTQPDRTRKYSTTKDFIPLLQKKRSDINKLITNTKYNKSLPINKQVNMGEKKVKLFPKFAVKDKLQHKPKTEEIPAYKKLYAAKGKEHSQFKNVLYSHDSYNPENTKPNKETRFYINYFARQHKKSNTVQFKETSSTNAKEATITDINSAELHGPSISEPKNRLKPTKYIKKENTYRSKNDVQNSVFQHFRRKNEEVFKEPSTDSLPEIHDIPSIHLNLLKPTKKKTKRNESTYYPHGSKAVTYFKPYSPKYNSIKNIRMPRTSRMKTQKGNKSTSKIDDFYNKIGLNPSLINDKDMDGTPKIKNYDINYQDDVFAMNDDAFVTNKNNYV